MEKDIKPIKEVVIEKTYNVPVEKVWQAWTTPEIIKKWWGPDNVTTPECEMDLRVGGKVYIVMEAGEAMGQYKGTKWPMLGKFTIVKPNEKLAYAVNAWTDGAKETTTIDQSTEVTFAKAPEGTKIIVKAVIHKTGPDAKMAVEGMQYGFTQQLEKLNKLLSA